MRVAGIKEEREDWDGAEQLRAELRKELYRVMLTDQDAEYRELRQLAELFVAGAGAETGEAGSEGADLQECLLRMWSGVQLVLWRAILPSFWSQLG